MLNINRPEEWRNVNPRPTPSKRLRDKDLCCAIGIGFTSIYTTRQLLALPFYIYRGSG